MGLRPMDILIIFLVAVAGIFLTVRGLGQKGSRVVVNAAGNVILVPGLGCDRDHYSISPSFSVIQYFSHE